MIDETGAMSYTVERWLNGRPHPINCGCGACLPASRAIENTRAVLETSLVEQATPPTPLVFEVGEDWSDD